MPAKRTTRGRPLETDSKRLAPKGQPITNAYYEPLDQAPVGIIENLRQNLKGLRLTSTLG